MELNLKSTQDRVKVDASPFHEMVAENAAQFYWERGRKHLAAVEELMRQYTEAPGVLGSAAAYHISSGGKRWRPLFLLAVGEAMGCASGGMRPLAAAVELLHNASLVHDDLQDHDTLRRGKETVWKRYGDDMAINLGDFLITGTYRALSEIDAPKATVVRLVNHFAQSTHEVIAGQSAELSASRRLDVQAEDYQKIAMAKSGVLMALPVVSALMLADAEIESISKARKAMELLGLAYQIKDDLNDLYGRKDGRQAGVDLREGRMSLPTIHYYAMANQREQKRFREFMLRENEAYRTDIEDWVERMKRSPAVDKCMMDFHGAVQAASRFMGDLPNPLRSTLISGQHMLLNAIGSGGA